MSWKIELTIGAWSAVVHKGDLVDPAADALGVDPLEIGWDLDPKDYPGQPDPTTAKFKLYVPNTITGPRPNQGDPVTIEVSDTAWTPATGLPALCHFAGRISDVDATPTRDGLTYSIIAVDHTAALSEEKLGDEPWPEESRYDRTQRIIGASALPLVLRPEDPPTPASEETYLFIFQGGDLPNLPTRDVDSTETGDLLEEAFGPFYQGSGPQWWTVGWFTGEFEAPDPGEAIWVRPIVTQSIDPATGAVTLPVVYVTASAPSSPWALPYQLTHDAAGYHLERKAGLPDDAKVPWIPASAIDRDITWRQDKTRPNRVRISATSGQTFTGIGYTDLGSFTVEYPDLIEQYGPVEQSLEIDPPDSGGNQAPYNLAYAFLGTKYDATPRWNLDEFDVLPEAIADPAAWPRLFRYAQHEHLADTHAGRLVWVLDIPAKWNLHNSGDYFGRLLGATLRIAAGELRISTTLLHQLPAGAGMEMSDLLAGLIRGSTPAHSPLRWAQLANPGTDSPTWADLAGTGLTWADMHLTEGVPTP